jgi:hypothetical protein
VPLIRLPPSRPLHCRRRRPPTGFLGTPALRRAGSRVATLPHSRHRQRPTQTLSTRGIPRSQPSRRLPFHRQPLRVRRDCSNRQPSRCGGPTPCTGPAARPATVPAARFSRMSPHRRPRPCARLRSRSRQSRSSSDRPVVVQVGACSGAGRVAIPPRPAAWSAVRS